MVVEVAGQRHLVAPSTPLVFGRSTAHADVGLDPDDMGISGRAGSIEWRTGAWWLVNLSGKRPLLLEQATGAQVRVEKGTQVALTDAHRAVLVPGAIHTHRLELSVPEPGESPAAAIVAAETGTITPGEVSLSTKDRTVLAALFGGYLRPFPRHDPRPVTYQQAAVTLGAPWTPLTVRKQIERLKARLARAGVYFEGRHANEDLADHLMATGLLGAADLELLADPDPDR